MTVLQVRTSPDHGRDPGADVLLDWFSEKAASTVQVGDAFFKDFAPSRVAADFLRLGGAAFCADKLVLRDAAEDHWSRALSLDLPVSDVRLWEATIPLLTETLDFLSGDTWTLAFRAEGGDVGEPTMLQPTDSVVSLFSGGLDSLVGAIDLLEQGKTVVLVGHHDSALADNRQVELFQALRDHYGADRVSHRRLLLRPAAKRAKQAQPLGRGQRENTTRSRSLLFISAGVAVADSLGPDVPLYVPENGFIGINVPLTAARSASLSTRTTHPKFMANLMAFLPQLGLQHRLENPYRLMTKGELLAACRNPGLLAALAPTTISCSHPEAPRYRGKQQGNCGYCYPCLIRRASLHRFGLDSPVGYAWDALTWDELLDRRKESGKSMRSLLSSLAGPALSIDVLRNGPVPDGEAKLFFDLYERGRAEISKWLKTTSSASLRAWM